MKGSPRRAWGGRLPSVGGEVAPFCHSHIALYDDWDDKGAERKPKFFHSESRALRQLIGFLLAT